MTDPTGGSTTDIGPYYRIFGVFLAVLGAGLAALAIWKGITSPVIVLGLAGLFLLAVIIIVRPDWADRHFKDLMAALPTKYSKPDGAP